MGVWSCDLQWSRVNWSAAELLTVDSQLQCIKCLHCTRNPEQESPSTVFSAGETRTFKGSLPQQQKRCPSVRGPQSLRMCARVAVRCSRIWWMCAAWLCARCSGSCRIYPGSRWASWRSWRESSPPSATAPELWRINLSACRSTSQHWPPNRRSKVGTFQYFTRSFWLTDVCGWLVYSLS